MPSARVERGQRRDRLLLEQRTVFGGDVLAGARLVVGDEDALQRRDDGDSFMTELLLLLQQMHLEWGLINPM